MANVTQIEYQGQLFDIQDAEAQKNLVYSTTETKTGAVWIDGKPIFRCVFRIENLKEGERKLIDVSQLNIDEIIKVDGFYLNNQNIGASINCSDIVSTDRNIYIFYDNGILKIYVGSYQTIKNGYVILEYTKQS